MLVTSRLPSVTAPGQGSGAVDSSTRLWTMTLSSSGRHRLYCRARLLMRAVNSVTWV